MAKLIVPPPPEANVVVTPPSGDRTWNGSVDSDWFRANNWTPNAVPTIADDAIIPVTSHNPTIDGSSIAVAKTLHLAANATLTINNSLTVAEIIDNYGTITCNENASLIQIGNVINTGTGLYQHKVLSAPIVFNNYTYWGSPTSGSQSQTLRDFSPNSNPKYFLTYDNKWAYKSGSTKFEDGVGVSILAPLNTPPNIPTAMPFVFTGTVPNNGNISVALSAGTTLPYERLIANPYPSAIDAEDFILANAIVGNSISGWTHAHSTTANGYTYMDYVVVNCFGGALARNSDAGKQFRAGILDVGKHGFFVEYNTAGSVTFDNSMRHHHTGNYNKSRIGLMLTCASDPEFIVSPLIGYSDNVSSDTNPKYSRSTSNSAKLYVTKTGTPNTYFDFYAKPTSSFNAATSTFTLGSSITSGTYTICADFFDGLFKTNSIILVDNQTSTQTDLKTGSYTFTGGTASDNRFTVKFQPIMQPLVFQGLHF